MAKLSKKESNGTSFHDVIIKTTVNELIDKLGEPQYYENDGSDKVNVEFICETDGGDSFTIYDWEEYSILDNDKTHNFHIGTLDKNISISAKRELGF